MTLDYKLRVYGMLKYAFISVVAVTYAEWKGKAFHKVSI